MELRVTLQRVYLNFPGVDGFASEKPKHVMFLAYFKHIKESNVCICYPGGEGDRSGVT